jgi:hypothetical protein
MYQQLWGSKLKINYIWGVREQKRLNTTGVGYVYASSVFLNLSGAPRCECRGPPPQNYLVHF